MHCIWYTSKFKINIYLTRPIIHCSSCDWSFINSFGFKTSGFYFSTSIPSGTTSIVAMPTRTFWILTHTSCWAIFWSSTASNRTRLCCSTCKRWRHHIRWGWTTAVCRQVTWHRRTRPIRTAASASTTPRRTRRANARALRFTALLGSALTPPPRLLHYLALTWTIA